MLSLIVPFLFLLIRLSHATTCIALDPPGPFSVSLADDRASLTLDVSLCPNASFTVSAIPSQLAPSVSFEPLSSTSDVCHILRTTLAFQSHIGEGKLVFATPTCTVSAPIVVAGIVAFHPPSRDLVTAAGAPPIVIPAPRRASVAFSFDVKNIPPAGQTLRPREAVSAVNVNLSPSVPSVTASLGVGDISGKLQIVSINDGSDVPRLEVAQTVELREAKSGITAGFRIIHSPLLPTIRAVKAPAKLSPAGGEVITLVARRTAADQRRLVIGNITVIETEYLRRGNNYLSSFISPPLPWGKHIWRMELITGGNVTVAEDNSGHIFVVASIPILTSIIPGVAKPDTDGFVIISGTFEDSVLIFVDDEPPPSADIVHRAAGEIIMRLPRVRQNFNGTLPVVLRSVRGRKSNVLPLKFDPDAVYVDAVVPHASVTLSNGRFVIPFLCNHREPPVIFARADTPHDVYEPPTFNFSVRTSASPGFSFSNFSHGPNGMVSLDPELFGEEPELEKDFLTVFIVVTQGNQSGATLVFVSRRVRRDVLGVTILPPFEAQRGTGRTALEAQVSPLSYCRNATNFESQTVWSINKRRIISTDSNDVDETENGDSALAVGFGRTLVVPDVVSISYFARVNLIDRLTGKKMATGTSRNRRRLRALAPSLQVFLNGGLTSITLRTGLTTYEIHSNVYDRAVALSSEQVEYSWGCKPLSSEMTRCPKPLFPVSVRKHRDVSRDVSRFNITTVDVREGLAIEYSLTVRFGGRQVGTARLRLSVNPAEGAVFPSSKISASTSPPHVLSDGSMQFSCYHHIILAVLDPRMNDTYDFALFREGNDTEILESSADDFLIAHSGYWSSKERDGILFGIMSNKLEPANYTLFGTIDGKAEPGRGASWTFQVHRCPVLMPYKLPILSGTTSLTTFFAGAASVPPSRNLFFFELRKQEEGDTAPDVHNPDSASHSLECSGGQLCSFSVSAPGRYYIHINMYDPSGTQILSSERLETPITVFAPNATFSASDSEATESSARSMAVRASLLQEDKEAFLHNLLQLSPKESLETSVLEDAMKGLQKLSSSPTLVPIRGRILVAACWHLIRLEQVHHDLKRIDQIRRVAETTITNSVSNVGPADALRDPAVLFYSVLLQESSNLVRSDQENVTVSANIAKLSRVSAAQHLPLILATGRECGFLDQLVVNFPGLTRFNVSMGTPTVPRYDDYRIAISCFSGQARRMLPEPVSAELCSSSESSDRVFAVPQVLVSAEQDDLSNESPPGEILSGPTMQTRIMELKHGDDSIFMEEVSQANSACYKTRVSVYVSKELAEHLLVSSRTAIDITCEPEALPVSSFDIQGEGIPSPKSETRTFTIGADGRMSAFLEVSPPVSARLTVNETRLRQCIVVTRLDGNRSASTKTIVLSVLGAIGLVFVVVTVIICCIRYKRRDDYSIPDSLAPWGESFNMSQSRTQSTLGSYYYASGELHRIPNRWEGEYRPVQNRGSSNDPTGPGTEGAELSRREASEVEERRPGRVPGSVLENCEPLSRPRVSSLLTATDSYTTSSGELSNFVQPNRIALPSRIKGLPGFYNPNGFPYPRISHEKI